MPEANSGNKQQFDEFLRLLEQGKHLDPSLVPYQTTAARECCVSQTDIDAFLAKTRAIVAEADAKSTPFPDLRTPEERLAQERFPQLVTSVSEDTKQRFLAAIKAAKNAGLKGFYPTIAWERLTDVAAVTGLIQELTCILEFAVTGEGMDFEVVEDSGSLAARLGEDVAPETELSPEIKNTIKSVKL